MKSIEQLINNINDPEALKRMALFLNAENAKLSLALKKQQALNAEKEQENQAWLDQTLKVNLHKLQRVAFGFGREVNKLRDRERRKSEKQLTLQTTSLVAENEDVENIDLPVEEKIYLQPEEDLLEKCHLSGLSFKDGDQIEIKQIPNFFEESVEITVTTQSYKKIRNKRAKYKAKNLTTGEEKILTAPGPVKLYPKCQFSVDLSVHAVTQKFLNSLPYERQIREMKRSGLNMSTTTLCRLETGVSLHLEEVAEKIREDILNIKHLAVGLDETGWPILNSKDSDGHFWILCNQAGSYYRFEPSRSGEVALELLQGFRGSLISDKFSGYLQFISNKNITWGLCLAHARREFISLQGVYEKECSEIIDLMDQVFKLEHKARNWEELLSLRKNQSSSLMENLKLKLEEIKKEFFPRDELTKAANYVLSNWQEFTAFLEDIRLPVSNNESERALRQAVLGRKNYRGSKTIDAADRAAILFTVIESCKKAELDPEDYIKYVITENHEGREALTPLNLALEKRGKSIFWPDASKSLILSPKE